MKELTFDKIQEFIKNKYAGTLGDKKFSLEVMSFYEEKAILGIDIFRYSQFNQFEQTLIPFIFNEIFINTISDCKRFEKIFFEDSEDVFTEYKFISTGDGGFQVFNSPLQAVVFTIYFQSNLRLYNIRDSKISEINNEPTELICRYALTLGNIIKTSDNFYGPGIITNSRIISRDKLNRFLIDDKSLKWFRNEIGGIENLMSYDYSDILHSGLLGTKFNTPDPDEIIRLEEQIKDNTLLFKASGQSIITADMLTIGEISVKGKPFSIHSIHMQIRIIYYNLSKQRPYRKFTFSIGNLFTEGISDDK